MHSRAEFYKSALFFRARNAQLIHNPPLIPDRVAFDQSRTLAALNGPIKSVVKILTIERPNRDGRELGRVVWKQLNQHSHLLSR
jgi:hypothetical protein